METPAAASTFANSPAVLGAAGGSHLPAHIVSNDELARTVDTTDEWIVQRTGIRERHVAAPGELTEAGVAVPTASVVCASG